MSSDKKSETPAYSDAEKGTLEPLSISVHNVQPLSYSEDKKTLVDVAPPKFVDVKQSLPATAVIKAAKASPKPKRKVSKWILFQLWFNTYR